MSEVEKEVNEIEEEEITQEERAEGVPNFKEELQELRKRTLILSENGVDVTETVEFIAQARKAFAEGDEVDAENFITHAEVDLVHKEKLLGWTKRIAVFLYSGVLLETFLITLFSYLILGRWGANFNISWKVPAVGAMGSFAYCIYFGAKYFCNKTFDPYYSIEYILRIPLGAILASVFLWGFRAGLFSMQQNGLQGNSNVEDFSLFLAFIAGFMTDYAVAALRRIADAIMKPNKVPAERDE